MNIFFASNLTFLIYLYSNPFRLSIKSFTSIHFTIYISYWPALLIFISHVPYIFEPSLPRQHHGNHTVGYCASYFVFFMNKYVNINISNNSGLRNDSIKNITFSVTAGRQLSCGLPWIPQNFFCNREKSVCACIFLIHYGPFTQEIEFFP